LLSPKAGEIAAAQQPEIVIIGGEIAERDEKLRGLACVSEQLGRGHLRQLEPEVDPRVARLPVVSLHRLLWIAGGEPVQARAVVAVLPKIVG
jgi:hypothetical protein